MKTFIFDMDGTLIDSEPFWRVAEKAVFRREGVNITDEMCLDVQGKKAEHVVEQWMSMFPNLKYDVAYYVSGIQKLVAEQIVEKGSPMVGVLDTLKLIKQAGHNIIVASSSTYKLIDTVLDKLKIREYFSLVHSSQDEKRGKPFPDVFINAAQRVNAKIEDCIVIEDSGNGVRAGKAAQMVVVAIPAPENFENPVFDIADYKIKTMSEMKNLNLW